MALCLLKHEWCLLKAFPKRPKMLFKGGCCPQWAGSTTHPPKHAAARAALGVQAAHATLGMAPPHMPPSSPRHANAKRAHPRRPDAAWWSLLEVCSATFWGRCFMHLLFGNRLGIFRKIRRIPPCIYVYTLLPLKMTDGKSLFLSLLFSVSHACNFIICCQDSVYN